MATEKAIEPVWTVAANIVAERPYGPGGKERKRGTKYFRGGTKVYIIDWYAGMCEKIIVVGQARKTGRMIKIVIKATWVENLRVKLCYNPQVIEKIKEHYPGSRIGELNQEFAQTMYSAIPYWQQEINKTALPTNPGPVVDSNIFSKLWSWLTGTGL